MTSFNTAQARYSTGAIILHWTMALLIMVNLALVLVRDFVQGPVIGTLMGNHKAIGLILLVLAVLRLVWRLMHKPPPLEPTLKPWERVLAKLNHWLFYAFMIAVPLTGWMMVSDDATGEPVAWPLGLPVPELPVDKATGGVSHDVHVVFGYCMLALLVLHVAAALKHQYLDRNATLPRMAPWLGVR